MKPLSVCIATHERPASLLRTLAALEAQTAPPLEVVISDSSSAPAPELERALARTTLFARRVASSRRALPWQRWWALQHATGEVVLFLDDDVALAPGALASLGALWERLDAPPGTVAGIGLCETDPEGRRVRRVPGTARERWLGLGRVPSGGVSPGGLTATLDVPEDVEAAEVDWLWGGAMSYSRRALLQIGLLDRLAALYDEGYGKGEDGVLAAQARRHGRLYAAGAALGRHGEPVAGGARAVPQSGWRRGMWGTWGRAHTMRWVARDRSALRADWARVAGLETARAFAGVARRPWAGRAWARVGGTLWGSLRAIAGWSRIPNDPSSGGAPEPVAAPAPGTVAASAAPASLRRAR